MDAESEPQASEAVAGLIVEDSDGAFYLIAWADLVRFRISTAYAAALRTATTGAERGEPIDTDVLGFTARFDAEGTRALLVEVLGAPGETPPAVRRLAAWFVLR